MTDELKPEMFWIDLETTGLNAETDRPLEIGVILTDKYLKPVDSWKALIWEANDDYALSVMNAVPYVASMHDKNGLWHDLNDPSTDKLTRDDVSEILVEWLTAAGIEPRTMPMAGSSIGSLDRPFVQAHFPALNDFLHYRNIDISSIKELCRLWRPDLIHAYEEQAPSDAKWHRVLEDAQGSIDEYKFYIESGFIQIPTPDFLKVIK